MKKPFFITHFSFIELSRKSAPLSQTIIYNLKKTEQINIISKQQQQRVTLNAINLRQSSIEHIADKHVHNIEILFLLTNVHKGVNSCIQRFKESCA